MADWNGRGTNARVRARRDAVLAVLFAADRPLTMREVTDRVAKTVSQSSIYADLRALSHSSARLYSDMEGAVNDPGYPVIWNTWFAGDTVGHVTFELTPECRDDMLHAAAQLEAMWELSDG